MKWFQTLLKGLLLTAVLFLFTACFEDRTEKEDGPYIDKDDNPATVEMVSVSGE